MMQHVYDAISTFWHELIARPAGPLGFRFIMQPLMAVALAVRDGVKDARAGRTPYFWTIQNNPTLRMSLLKEGVRAIGRLLVITALMDVIYQVIVFHRVRPFETLVIMLVLAFLPYLFLRGPVERIMARVIRNKAAHQQPSSPPFGRDATRTADPGQRDRQSPNDTD